MYPHWIDIRCCQVVFCFLSGRKGIICQCHKQQGLCIWLSENAKKRDSVHWSVNYEPDVVVKRPTKSAGRSVEHTLNKRYPTVRVVLTHWPQSVWSLDFSILKAKLEFTQSVSSSTATASVTRQSRKEEEAETDLSPIWISNKVEKAAQVFRAAFCPNSYGKTTQSQMDCEKPPLMTSTWLKLAFLR